MSLNKVIILGNLGRDPELRYTPKQVAVCTMSLATTEKQKDATGAWVDHTEWHRVVVFGKQGENCANYLKKGSTALVEGRLKTSKYQDKTSGQDRYSTDIVADNVRFIGGRASANTGNDSHQQFDQGPNNFGGGNGGNAALAGLATADDLTSFDQGSGSVQDDDIPF